VELEKWEQTLHGGPWRTTKGAAPCAVKVACTVLNGEREETYRKATRLALTQRNTHPDIPCLLCQPDTSKSQGAWAKLASKAVIKLLEMTWVNLIYPM